MGRWQAFSGTLEVSSNPVPVGFPGFFRDVWALACFQSWQPRVSNCSEVLSLCASLRLKEPDIF